MPDYESLKMSDNDKTVEDTEMDAATETAEPKARRSAWYLNQGGALSLAIEQNQLSTQRKM